jgi:hypothetical protein
MKKLLFLSILLVTVSTMAQDQKAETPKIAVKMELGQTITLEGVNLTFKDVIEDSRCPKYTNCIWAGRAVVLVEVEVNGKKEQKKIYLGETRNNEPTSKALFSKEGYFIEVVALNPYPEDGKEKAPYTLLVCESK